MQSRQNFHMLVLLPLIVFILSFRITAQQVRPVCDDIGFCWRSNEFNALIDYLDKINTDNEKPSGKLTAGISPHDDYLYASSIYYPLFRNIKAREVVIFGVTHGTVRKEINDPKNVIILDEFSEWIGPEGPVKTSPLRELIKSKLNPGSFVVNNKAQALEHSIEAMIPFLQHYNKNVKITPIMVTAMQFGQMDSVSNELSSIIADYISRNNLKPGEDVFFLISSDANHYGADFNNTPFGDDETAHKLATDKDKKIANQYFNEFLSRTEIENLTRELWAQTPEGKAALSWCGRYSIPFGLLTTLKVIEKTTHQSLKGKLLRYSDTWTEGVIPIKNTHMGLTAPFSLKHWVGFLSAGFYIN